MSESPAKVDAWSRPAFLPGAGNAFVFYAFYVGAGVAPTLHVSAEKHRTTGLPEGIELFARDRDHPAFTPAGFALFGDPEAFEDAAASPFQFIVAGTVEDPSDLRYLRDIVGVAAALVDAGATTVFDLQTLRLFTGEEFLREVFDPDAPKRTAHVAFLSSDDETNPGSLWLHTRGLRKFGRPDISIRGLAPEAAEVGADVLHRFAELGIRGGVVAEGRAITIAGFPEGFHCHHGGSYDDEEFNNIHLEIRRDP